jgi:hypothetical protein
VKDEFLKLRVSGEEKDQLLLEALREGFGPREFADFHRMKLGILEPAKLKIYNERREMFRQIPDN